MNSINFRQWAHRGVSTVLLTAVIATSSMVTLAASSKPVGELSVSGNSAEAVTVNGEPAKTGRTLFGDSMIATTAGGQAVLSIGKGVRIQLAPNTTFALSADPGSAAGSLTSGRLTVLSGGSGVSVRNLAGEMVKLTAGESLEATSTSAARQSGSIGGLEPWQLALIIGAAAAVVIILVTRGGDDDSTPISPIR